MVTQSLKLSLLSFLLLLHASAQETGTREPAPALEQRFENVPGADTARPGPNDGPDILQFLDGPRWSRDELEALAEMLNSLEVARRNYQKQSDTLLDRAQQMESRQLSQLLPEVSELEKRYAAARDAAYERLASRLHPLERTALFGALFLVRTEDIQVAVADRLKSAAPERLRGGKDTKIRMRVPDVKYPELPKSPATSAVPAAPPPADAKK